MIYSAASVICAGPSGQTSFANHKKEKKKLLEKKERKKKSVDIQSDTCPLTAILQTPAGFTKDMGRRVLYKVSKSEKIYIYINFQLISKQKFCTCYKTTKLN